MLHSSSVNDRTPSGPRIPRINVTAQPTPEWIAQQSLRYLLRWPVFQSPLKAHAPKIPTSNIAVPHEGIEAKAASAMIAMTMRII